MASASGDPAQPGPSPEAARFLCESLHLILLPTERCNFRCVYCYEQFELGRMPATVVDGVLNLLRATAPSLRWLSIEWFGGEPLLALDEIDRIQRGVAELREEFANLAFAGAMTTNGYLLTAERLARLVESGVSSFQVSLDGGRESHDERRVLADGRGTWGVIHDNLRAASRSELEFLVTIRVHVDRRNQAAVEPFVHELAGELAGDERFELLFRPVERLGGDNDALLPVLGEESAAVIERLAVVARSTGLRVRSSPDRTPCYAAMPNSLVIRPNGQVAKCTVALEDPRNHVGWLHPDGTLEMDRSRLSPWLVGLATGDRQALECPLETMAQRTEIGLPVVS